MIEELVAAVKDSATAYGAATIQPNAAAAISSGAAMIFSFAIICLVYHFPVNLKHLNFQANLTGLTELRHHLCSKPFHLLAILLDGGTDRV